MSIDALQKVIDDNKKLVSESEKLQKELSELKSQIAPLREKLKKYALFEDIVENPPKYWLVTIKDPIVCQRLNAYARVLYGKGTNVDSEKPESKRNIDSIVEDCLAYVLNDKSRWNQMIALSKRSTVSFERKTA